MERVVSALKVLRDVAKEFFDKYSEHGVTVITDVYYDNVVDAWFCVQVKNELNAIAVEIYYECRLADPPMFSAIVTEREVKVFNAMPGAAAAIDYIREYIEEMVAEGKSGE